VRRGSHPHTLDERRITIGLISEHESGFCERAYRDLICVELFEDGNTITKTSRSSQIGGANLRSPGARVFKTTR
jgi:hypothetical protein